MNADDRRFGRRLAVGLGAFVLLGAALRRRESSSGSVGCGKRRFDAQGPIEWLTSYDAAMREARRDEKLGLAFVGAEWDTGSKKLEHETFADPDVRAIVHARYVALYVDMTDDEAPTFGPLRDRFKVLGTPTIILFSTGFYQELVRFTEYMTPQRLLSALLYAPELGKDQG